MTKGGDFQKKQNVNMDIAHQCQRKHAMSKDQRKHAMSKEAWCDLKSKGNILKLQRMCPKPKCNC